MEQNVKYTKKNNLLNKKNVVKKIYLLYEPRKSRFL